MKTTLFILFVVSANLALTANAQTFFHYRSRPVQLHASSCINAINSFAHPNAQNHFCNEQAQFLFQIDYESHARGPGCLLTQTGERTYTVYVHYTCK